MNRISVAFALLASLAVAPLGAQGSAPAPAPVLRTSGAFFALVVGDIEAMRTWYAEKFGLATVMDQSTPDGARAVVLSGGDFTVELIRQPGAVPLRTAAPGITSPLGVLGVLKVGMFVDNYDDVIATLRARGVAFAMGPFPASDTQPANVIIRDPEGNYLQILAR